MTSYEMHQSTGRVGPSALAVEDTTGRLTGFYRCLIGLGAVQLFSGIAALALGIANAIVCGLLASIGYGIWGSLIYFAAGATGIVAYSRQTRCTVGSHMVMSIIAACTAAVQLAMGAGSAVADYAGEKIAYTYNTNDLNVFLYNQHNALDYFVLFGCSDAQRNTYWTWQASGPTVTDALLAAFGALQLIIAILSAVYSCRICICPPGVSLIAGHSTYSSQMTIVTKP